MDVCKENKKLRICVIVAAVIAAALVIGLLFSLFHVSWKKGGTDTKGPFRYGRHHDGSYEVRIDTTSLPDGTLVVTEDTSGALVTKEKGKKGNEQVYRIKDKADYVVTWRVLLYADKTAQKNGEYRYALEIVFNKDKDKKVQVLEASARDIAPIEHFTKDDYDISYQLTTEKQNKEDGIRGVSLDIGNALSNEWGVSYDEKLLTVSDFFYGSETVSTSIATVDGQKGSFKTDVCLYTVKVTENGDTHGTEIVLHVKGKDGVITGVTHE